MGDDQSEVTQQDGVTSANGLATVSLSMDSQALKAGPSHSYTASLKFFDQDGMMLDGIQLVSSEPWMITMGHGSIKDSLAFMQHDELGHHWMVTGVQFSMGGDAGSWVMKTSFSINGETDSVDLPIPYEVGY